MDLTGFVIPVQWLFFTDGPPHQLKLIGPMESLLHEMFDPSNLVPTVAEVTVKNMANDARLPTFILEFILGHLKVVSQKQSGRRLRYQNTLCQVP
jgi:hypothetical protein